MFLGKRKKEESPGKPSEPGEWTHYCLSLIELRRARNNQQRYACQCFCQLLNTSQVSTICSAKHQYCRWCDISFHCSWNSLYVSSLAPFIWRFAAPFNVSVRSLASHPLQIVGSLNVIIKPMALQYVTSCKLVGKKQRFGEPADCFFKVTSKCWSLSIELHDITPQKNVTLYFSLSWSRMKVFVKICVMEFNFYFSSCRLELSQYTAGPHVNKYCAPLSRLTYCLKTI
jgi:hypothetical protein